MKTYFIFFAYMSPWISYNIMLLFNLYTESKILTFANKIGRPAMVAKKALNENFI